ncbi:hypothetical protein V490_00399 [Pseudogymnoascus sp. VKM F-3557]|nr:hypothetical protein V490_00399 [Pseudogymnoascus sp. VKM F-3557]
MCRTTWAVSYRDSEEISNENDSTSQDAECIPSALRQQELALENVDFASNADGEASIPLELLPSYSDCQERQQI